MKKLTTLLIMLMTFTLSWGQGDLPPEKIEDPEEYIRKETINGKLDFNKVLEEKDQSLFLYDGVAYNKKDFAIFLWGQAVKRLGIKSAKKATKLWEQIYDRELKKPEAKALIKGFKSKIE